MVLKLDGAGQNGFEEDEITWFSNMYHNIISIILGLEGYEITWYSNSRLE